MGVAVHRRRGGRGGIARLVDCVRARFGDAAVIRGLALEWMKSSIGWQKIEHTTAPRMAVAPGPERRGKGPFAGLGLLHHESGAAAVRILHRDADPAGVSEKLAIALEERDVERNGVFVE